MCEYTRIISFMKVSWVLIHSDVEYIQLLHWAYIENIVTSNVVLILYVSIIVLLVPLKVSF